MTLYEIGRMCIKIAGRDAGRKCVVVEVVDDRFVVIDGDVRRKKVNVKHLEPLAETVELKDKASHEEVKTVFEKLSLIVWEKKSKKATERPKKQKKQKVKAEKPKAKKEAKPKVEEKPVEKLVEPETKVETEKAPETTKEK